MTEYDRELLTEREKEYFDCDIPVTGGIEGVRSVVGGVIVSFFAAVGRALVTPGSDYSEADKKLMYRAKLVKYSKYKNAVLRKASSSPEKGDQKILDKINKQDFIFAQETFDPDEYTRNIYREYLKLHPELREKEDFYER